MTTRESKTTAAPKVTGEVSMARDWKSLIDEMALSGLARELAGHCVLKEHTGDKLHLVLLPSQEHLLKTSQRDRLQSAITEHFGKGVKLVISVENSDEETPKQEKERLEEDRKKQAVTDFNEDPAVKEMVDIFDASIEQNSIQPL
jgi:DNA polymerase-3 subunit gamma/tau